MSSSSSLSGARRRRAGGGSGPTSTSTSAPPPVPQRTASGLKSATPQPTQNNSNQQIAKELEKQNNLRQSQFLMNLSKQLLTPNAPASLPSTSNCTVRGTGVNKSITCY